MLLVGHGSAAQFAGWPKGGQRSPSNLPTVGPEEVSGSSQSRFIQVRMPQDEGLQLQLNIIEDWNCSPLVAFLCADVTLCPGPIFWAWIMRSHSTRSDAACVGGCTAAFHSRLASKTRQADRILTSGLRVGLIKRVQYFFSDNTIHYHCLLLWCACLHSGCNPWEDYTGIYSCAHRKVARTKSTTDTRALWSLMTGKYSCYPFYWLQALESRAFHMRRCAVRVISLYMSL